MSLVAVQVFGRSQLKISGITSLAGGAARIKGAQNGTVTDASGNYQIIAKDTDLLFFFFVGREKTEIAVNKKDHINFVLKESNCLIKKGF
ncbi:carboxypeptidase-like regulatory domain-containing protein [Sphingobacterium puteale]|uniref:carboxypeptidase-like regulatory domain-containing protein n=1 Tax=Sphingobacterium puteale TaxID=2420510 RepID=UPI003D97934F